jgi:hypothetical protein
VNRHPEEREKLLGLYGFGTSSGHSGQDLAERIEQLQVGAAYIQTPEMPYGSLVHMYPLEES